MEGQLPAATHPRILSPFPAEKTDDLTPNLGCHEGYVRSFNRE